MTFQKMKIPATGILLVIVGIIAGVLLVDTDKPYTSAISGMEIESSISELAAVSDVVIQGTVLKTVSETRPLPDTDIPEGSTRPQVDRYMVVQSHQIEVSEYLQGSGPKILTVFQSNPADDIATADTRLLNEDEE